MTERPNYSMDPRKWPKSRVYFHLKDDHGRTFRHSVNVYAVGYLRDMHLDEHLLKIADHHHGKVEA